MDTYYKNRQYLYKNKQCTRCERKLKKRKKPPYTAARDGHLYFDYYQCPSCKINYAYDKED